jgi:putative salt-induced outer membrane protein YdiY
LLYLSLLPASPALADTVLLDNGDRLTGKVKNIAAGKLVIETRYAGEVKVDLAAVRSLETDQDATVILKDYSRLIGRLAADQGALRVIEGDGGPVRTVDPGRVARVEQGRRPQPSWTYTGYVNIGASDSSGNTETTRAYGDAELVARKARNRVTLGGRGAYASDDDEETENNVLAYGKYDRFLSEKWYAYANASAEHDPFRDIKLRSTLGVGSGYQVFDTPRTNFSVEGGLDYVTTDFYDEEDTDFPAAKLGLRFDYWVWEQVMQFFHRSDSYASLDDIRNSFVRTQTGLRFPLKDRFSVQLQLNLDWEGDPAPGRESTDRTVTLSLGYNW